MLENKGRERGVKAEWSVTRKGAGPRVEWPGGIGVESSQPMIIHILPDLSSFLLVLAEFADGASFEQILRKRKKTKR